jgi:hypothetical protein
LISGLNTGNTSSKENLNPTFSNDQLSDILKRLKQLENDMKTKLDCDVFDSEITGLKAMIDHIDTGDSKNKVQHS